MLTINPAISDYLGHLKARNLSPASLKLYGDALLHLADVLRNQGRLSVNKVVSQDLDAWMLALSRQGLSSGVRRNRCFLVRRFFRWQDGRFENIVHGSRSPLAKAGVASNQSVAYHFLERRPNGGKIGE